MHRICNVCNVCSVATRGHPCARLLSSIRIVDSSMLVTLEIKYTLARPNNASLKQNTFAAIVPIVSPSVETAVAIINARIIDFCSLLDLSLRRRYTTFEYYVRCPRNFPRNSVLRKNIPEEKMPSDNYAPHYAITNRDTSVYFDQDCRVCGWFVYH